MRPSVETSGGNAAVAQPGKAPTQLEIFEQAMRLFHLRKFREAREAFAKAAAGPDRQIAHKAGLHVRMCNQRLEEQPLVLSTSEEHYNYAITQINARNLAAAQQHLKMALESDSNADHVHYALALCYGLGGDLQNAHDSLKRAIDLQPRNRTAARQDADFAPFASQPVIENLLYPEKKS